MRPESDIVLDVQGLNVHIQSGTSAAATHVIRDVSFTVRRHQRLAIVGESGSGKSVTALSILRLLDPGASRISGRVLMDGENLLAMSQGQLRKYRGGRIGMIFQDPMTSLNPVARIGKQMTSALRLHKGLDRRSARNEAIRLLDAVQIPAAKNRFRAFPHELSGGMRQRVMIGLALSMEPDLLIADEPTTALDVSVQAQVMSILRERTETLGTAAILITHDLGLVAEFADDVLVMYGGRIVEFGPVRRIFANPGHPYTAGLLASLCTLESDPNRPLPVIGGSPPQLTSLPNGCAFHPRCWMSTDVCSVQTPDLMANTDPHLGMSACHHAWNIGGIPVAEA